MNTGYVLVAAAPGGGWDHMGNGGWSGWMWGRGAAMVLPWVAAIGAILAERYARGEIGTEEYDERLAKLR